MSVKSRQVGVNNHTRPQLTFINRQTFAAIESVGCRLENFSGFDMVYAYLKSSHLSYYEKLTLATLLIFTCATALAADYEKGYAVAEAGDYATAFSE